MNMSLRVVTSLCGGLALSIGLRAQPVRPVAPVEQWPRDAEAFAKKEAAPQYQNLFVETYPELSANWAAGKANWDALYERFIADENATCDALEAALLLENYYVDWGHPLINSNAARAVTDAIKHMADWPRDRLPDDARDVLTQGVLAMLAGGGGREDPGTQVHTAEALDRLAPEDPEIQEIVDVLTNDALGWAEDLASYRQIYRWVVRRFCYARWGDAFALRAYELDRQHAGGMGGTAVAERPARYEAAVRALLALLTDTPKDRTSFARRLRQATDGALESFPDEELNDDLTGRLLVVFQRLLLRRPAVPDLISTYMQNRLRWLAAHSGRLKNDEHWRLWGEAVSAVGAWRCSSSLRSYLNAELHRKNLAKSRREMMVRLKQRLEPKR